MARAPLRSTASRAICSRWRQRPRRPGERIHRRTPLRRRRRVRLPFRFESREPAFSTSWSGCLRHSANCRPRFPSASWRSRHVAGPEPLLPQSGDVFGGGTPEETAVLPAELRRTQVADAVARIGRVHPLKEQEPPGFVQPQHLLVLERAHRGHGFEPLMECRRAHANRGGHLIDGHGLREMRANPGHGFGDPIHSRLRLSDLGHASSYGRRSVRGEAWASSWPSYNRCERDACLNLVVKHLVNIPFLEE